MQMQAKIIIGRDSMFSYDIDLWAGMDIQFLMFQQEKILILRQKNSRQHRNAIIIGACMGWKEAHLLCTERILESITVGAKSVVKGQFPNNCSIGGTCKNC